MPRSNTSQLQSLKRPDVTYSFPSVPGHHVTTITVPPQSEWTSGPHWHCTHTEFLQIKSGTALVALGGITRSVTASSGVVTVERGIVHEWRRDPTEDTVLVVEESTYPGDGQKELFFRNFSSALLDMTSTPSRAPPPLGLPLGWWINLQLFVIFKAFDNYPVLASGIAGTILTYSALYGAAAIGSLLGVTATYNEYTPTDRLSKKKDE